MNAKILRNLLVGMSILFVIGSLSNAFAQTDSGPRGGSAGAGGPIAGLTSQERQFFEQGLEQFLEVQSVQGELFFPDTEPGLGPTFNMDSCAGCHAQPVTGGTSPFVNPQVAVSPQSENLTFILSVDGLPFIRENGPVREARFKRNPDGTPDGGVHGLFTIEGRIDAPDCTLAQPNFARQNTAGNLSARIPTPVFGAGLIENIPDFAILANKAANARQKAALGISGRENREGNAGTITRFGWKAQNKSLVIFSGEAYNVEQGVTNELFPQEREDLAAARGNCLFNPLPEDVTNTLRIRAQAIPSNVDLFGMFQRFLAPPARAPITASVGRGEAQFNSIGCNLCHTPQLTTGTTAVAALSNQPVNLFSDLLVHNMGTGLADGISQGNAGPDEFRTSPLWGLGQRIFFLHDGRTDDLLMAIAAHSSRGSEANGVISAFNGLTPNQKQDILNFLRSL